jgi:hypothetical protein
MDADELYGLPLDEFVPRRAALGKELRAAGDRAAAADVAALRKPSVAAWAVNQLVRTQPRAINELYAAGDALTDTQEQLMAGRGNARALREANGRERAAVDALIMLARGLLSSEGDELSPAVLDRVADTLNAAALDPGARAAVRDGRLERELRHAGLGALGGGGAPAGSGSASGSGSGSASGSGSGSASGSGSGSASGSGSGSASGSGSGSASGSGSGSASRSGSGSRSRSERVPAAGKPERKAAPKGPDPRAAERARKEARRDARVAEADARRRADVSQRALRAAEQRREVAARALAEADEALARAHAEADAAVEAHRSAKTALDEL